MANSEADRFTTEIVCQLSAEPASLEQVHAGLAQLRAAIPAAQAAADHWYAFETACIEVLTNLIRYAYPADRPHRPIRLHLLAADLTVCAVFHDEGRAFDGSLDDLTLPPELSEGGYGLFIARNLLDRMAYYRTPEGTNCWELEKVLAETERPGEPTAE